MRLTESALAQLAAARRGRRGAALVGCDDETVPPRATSSRRARSNGATRASTRSASCRPTAASISAAPRESSILRAQNLLQFLEIAAGVDDDTWRYHFRRADYSRWFRDVIKDPELAAEAAAVERDGFLSRDDALAALRTAVESRYTLPADAPLPVPGAS